MTRRGPYRWTWLSVWDDVLRRLWRRSNARIAAELSLAFSPQHFTAYQVRHRRRVLGLAYGRHRHAARLALARAARRRLYQHRRGWAHLLDDYPLAPHEVDILCLLRDQGPLTRPEIAEALGCKLRRRHGSSCCLRLLHQWGLVRWWLRRRTGRGRWLPVYALDGDALTVTDNTDRGGA